MPYLLALPFVIAVAVSFLYSSVTSAVVPFPLTIIYAAEYVSFAFSSV